MECQVVPLPSERSLTNPSADRRLLYSVEPRKLPSYWTKDHQIYVRCTMPLLINIVIYQHMLIATNENMQRNNLN